MGISIKWDITPRCNFRCPQCCNASYTRGEKGKTPELSLEETKEIIDKMVASKSVTGVTLMGGEPALRRDLEDIIRYCTERGIVTQIVSNGSPLTPQRIDSLLEAGNWGFTVSIDGATPEAYGYTRPFRVFPHLLKHFRYLSDRIHEIREAGGPYRHLSINSLLHRKNLNSAAKMVDLAVDLRADSLSFLSLVMPPEIEDQKLAEWQRSYTRELVPTAEECIEAAIQIGKRIDARFNPDVADLDVSLKFLSPVVRDYLAVKYDIQLPLIGKECAAVTRIGSLNHDGSMVICEAFDRAHEAVDAGVINAQPLSLREHSFLEIWNSEAYQQMFSWVFKEDIYDYMEPCRRCPHLYETCRPCPERAIALAATGSHDRWYMGICGYVANQAGDLFALKEQADAALGAVSEEQIANALARAN